MRRLLVGLLSSVAFVSCEQPREIKTQLTAAEFLRNDTLVYRRLLQNVASLSLSDSIKLSDLVRRLGLPVSDTGVHYRVMYVYLDSADTALRRLRDIDLGHDVAASYASRLFEPLVPVMKARRARVALEVERDRRRGTEHTRTRGTFYVIAPVAEERSGPLGIGAPLNKIYRGQRVTVYRRVNNWALVSPEGFEQRWVDLQLLARDKPRAAAPGATTTVSLDPRIAQDAIPSVGENGLTAYDVDILRRGAAKFLESGRCTHVAYADKSVSRPNTYYLNCGGPVNVFFTPADLR